MIRQLKSFYRTASLVTLSLLLFSALPVQILGYGKVALASAQISASKYNHQELHLKIKDDQAISLLGGKFVGQPADQVNQLNAILSSASKIGSEKLITNTATNDLEAKVQSSVRSYYKVRFSQSTDFTPIISQLKALSIIETAYGAALPAPSPSSSFVNLQSYLQAAPTGIGSTAAKAYIGGNGSGVKIIDLEYSWNTAHEDLTKARIALVPNGTPIDPFNNNNHGTAVLGELIADDNASGVTGTAAGSNLRLINVNNAKRGYDPITALSLAASIAVPGDVVIIEQQAYGPSSDPNGFVPIEWIPEMYDGIRALTSNGITVVEPAANGSQNLDDATLYGTSFPMGKADSGALIVGAGNSCTGTQLLSRISYSNYGKRVDLQGPGQCVVTTGYGDLGGTAGVNSNYTAYFSGTSAATPVVAGAAADLSATYLAKNKTVMSPATIRSSLINYGTPQNTASGTVTGKIGPLPNVDKSISMLTTTVTKDTTPPSAPTNLVGVLNAQNQPKLSWGASTDNVAVANYRVYRNGVYFTSTTALSYVDINAQRGISYRYTIAAIDAAGNISTHSNAVNLKPR